MTFETAQLGTEVDAIAPDGSEIRLMGARPGGTFAHCTLAPGATSLAGRGRGGSGQRSLARQRLKQGHLNA
jgi:hypothetical protein